MAEQDDTQKKKLKKLATGSEKLVKIDLDQLDEVTGGTAYDPCNAAYDACNAAYDACNAAYDACNAAYK
ncbi:MAG: hypothetical protein AAGF11_18680 [Myxococcota bacterium]